MAQISALRVQKVGDFRYLLEGASFVCELPVWVDHTAQIRTIQDVAENETKIVLVQANHAAVYYDRENEKWRPL